MKTFFEFMEKIRRERRINEQGEQQPPAQPANNQTAPDATPEQQDGNQTSDPAHDSEFEKLVQIMKSSMESLSDENRKRVEDFLKDNNLMDTDASGDKGDKPADAAQPPQDPAAAQAQAGQMAAAAPPAAPAPGATPPQQ